MSELAEIPREHGALFHSDAAHAVGKIGVDVDQMGVELLTLGGHEMYAPKGIGALYVRAPRTSLTPSDSARLRTLLR